MNLAVFFMTPWAAAATLAGAASIPIIIHLLHRKRYRVVDWAAMRFLLAAQKRAARKLRIEQWLLLALRTLLVVLLILAMVSALSWMDPVWARLFPGGVASKTTRFGRVHRIIVLDGSYSMARKHQDGSSFDRAVRWSRDLIRRAQPGDGLSLIVLGTPTQTIVAGPSDNTASVLRELDELRLAHGNSDLAAGLDAVERLVTQPLGKYQQREVYLLTDLQRTFFQSSGLRVLQAKAAPGESVGERVGEADAWQRIQERAPVIVVDVAQSETDNLAVTSIALSEPLTLTGVLNSVTATVHNFGRTDRKQLKVDLLVGKARSESGDTEPFALRIQQQVLVDVPAGTAVPVTFPHKFLSAGEYVVQVRIESDALDVDLSLIHISEPT
ncbi:MAG: BatA domain-containing protein, partial [Gemmataceae bacterium]|nr:BatA domain-containing protein [Gemmataceae bacterium]